MGATALVDIDLDAAHATLGRLSNKGFSIGAAMILKDETGNRHLNIYSGLVEMVGPAESYRQLQRALAGLAGLLPLRSIKLLPFNRPEAQALRGAFGVPPGSVIRLQETVVNGYFYDDVILLRSPPV
jgi:hypothetical protein